MRLVDLPGTYSLAPRSPDETVTVDVLLGRQGDVQPPDAVLCIVDATNLERNLYLVSQVLELGLPMVLALNMVDLAAAARHCDRCGPARAAVGRSGRSDAGQSPGRDERIEGCPGSCRRSAGADAAVAHFLRHLSRK